MSAAGRRPIAPWHCSAARWPPPGRWCSPAAVARRARPDPTRRRERPPSADASPRDVELLTAALELERRTVDAYVACIPLLSKTNAKAAVVWLSAEIQHTGELIGADLPGRGARRSRAPTATSIGPMPSNQGQALALLASLEQLQISYYLRIIARAAAGDGASRGQLDSLQRRPAHRAPAPRAGQARGPVRVRDVTEPPRHRSATRRELLAAGAVAGAAALAAPALAPAVAAAASGGGSTRRRRTTRARLTRVLSMAVLAAYVYQQVFAERRADREPASGAGWIRRAGAGARRGAAPGGGRRGRHGHPPAGVARRRQPRPCAPRDRRAARPAPGPRGRARPADRASSARRSARATSRCAG